MWRRWRPCWAPARGETAEWSALGCATCSVSWTSSERNLEQCSPSPAGDRSDSSATSRKSPAWLTIDRTKRGKEKGWRTQLSRFGCYLLVGPVYDGDFRAAVPTHWQEGPSEASMDVEAMPGVLVSPGNPASTAGWEPECGHSGKLPLTAVTVSAQDQVYGVVLVHHVENVRRVGQK